MILDDKLDAGELIILDGATGSEIPSFGGALDKVAWCGAANKFYPNAVRQVHEAYLRAGVDIITTNTFSTCRHVLDGVGLGDETVAINTRAVELARQARDTVSPARPVAIAGSMSTAFAWETGKLSPDPKYFLSAQQCADNYREVAQTLKSAGVDFLILEMVADLTFGPMLAEAALEPGLPVWCGMSCTAKPDGSLSGWDLTTEHPEVAGEVSRYTPPAPFDALVDKFIAKQPRVLGIMHSQVNATHRAVDRLKDKWRGPLMAYPETITREDATRPGTLANPEEFARACVQLVDNGVQIIGGCCGTSIAHIRAMIEALPTKPVAS